VEAADPEKMAFPLPDKPSIAVIPFDNMSGDPWQEFICDGIVNYNGILRAS
jgi:adenylate cyclase